MGVKEWAAIIVAVLGVIAAIIGLFSYKKGGKKKVEKNRINQESQQGGVNISAEHGSTVNVSGLTPVQTQSANPAKSKETNSNAIEDESNTDKGSMGLLPSDIIKLQSVYTSLFAEDNQLKTETIYINKQENGCIEGKVELNEKDAHGETIRSFTYSLSGVFANKILTAEYKSIKSNSDERGAVNLKMIDADILSGFCSFSKLSIADDEIRVSPYVWVAGEKKNLIDGTYDFCTDCYMEKAVCCCASEDIDMPLFLDSETNNIRSMLDRRRQSKSSYSIALPKPYEQTNVRQIIRDEKNNPDGKSTVSKCHFFDYNSRQCRIYSGRPIDCRLFPFDIKLSKNKDKYIIGYYTDLCARPLPNHNIMRRNAHILRPYFFLLYPYLHIYTAESVCKRLKNAEFKEIASFQEFIF